MRYEYEIRITSTDLTAKALMELKQATGLSLGEVKRRAESGEALLGCECSDDDGLTLILNLHDSLLAQGIEAALYEDGEIKEAELLRNVLESWHDTSHEVGLDEL